MSGILEGRVAIVTGAGGGLGAAHARIFAGEGAAVGVNVQRHQLVGLIIAAFFAGVAGALHAYVYRGVGFESFTLHESVSYLAMAIVGGLGTLNGSFWGPIAIKFLDLDLELTIPPKPPKK